MAEKVRVITSDARLFEGILQGYDRQTNIVLSDCIERILYDTDAEENQEIELGVYMVRGGAVVCVGLVDEVRDKDIDWMLVKASPLKGTKNPL